VQKIFACSKWLEARFGLHRLLKAGFCFATYNTIAKLLKTCTMVAFLLAGRFYDLDLAKLASAGLRN
jgi:hypothetical protein